MIRNYAASASTGKWATHGRPTHLASLTLQLSSAKDGASVQTANVQSRNGAIAPCVLILRKHRAWVSSSAEKANRHTMLWKKSSKRLLSYCGSRNYEISILNKISGRQAIQKNKTIMEQNDNNNITPDTREYEGRRYRLVTDEVGDHHECKRCPLNDKCDAATAAENLSRGKSHHLLRGKRLHLLRGKSIFATYNSILSQTKKL